MVEPVCDWSQVGSVAIHLQRYHVAIAIAILQIKYEKEITLLKHDVENKIYVLILKISNTSERKENNSMCEYLQVVIILSC